MGIKFHCQGCDKKLHVKAFLAGKRGVCPHCGAKVRIPLDSEQPRAGTAPATSKGLPNKTVQSTTATNSAPISSPTSSSPATSSSIKRRSPSPSSPAAGRPDPLEESPEAVWYVRPPTGGQYGPADGDIIRRWLEEGRVSADSLVWREGWNDWKTADSVFPSLGRAFSQPDGPAAAAGGKSPGSPTAADGPLATATQNDSPQEQISISGGKQVSPHAKTRLPSSSKARNVAIVVTLSIVCVGLLVALLVVLQNQG